MYSSNPGENDGVGFWFKYGVMQKKTTANRV